MISAHGMGAYRTMQTMGDRLKFVRRLRGFTGSRKAAARFGWNENTYKAHEGGANGYSAEQASDYAKAFRVSAGWLLTGEGEAPVGFDANKAASPDIETVAEAIASNARDPRPVEPDYSRDTIPVYGTAMGGPDGRFELNGQVVDRVAAPPGLRGTKDAYAVYVAGSSMEPRYFEGETVYLHPTKPVRQGDFVLLQLKPKVDGEPYEGLVKRLVSKGSAKVVVEQYNPPMKIEFAADEIRAIHRIVMGGE